MSFDDIRGYGFIVPDGGGADVFVHANELRDEKSMFRPGTAVEFDVVDGGRGPKAYAVRVLPAVADPDAAVTDGDSGPDPMAGPVDAPVAGPVDAPVAGPVDAPSAGPGAGPVVLAPAGPGDVLSARDYSRELTELFLEALPELTGAQIVRLRTSLLATARRHRWLEG